jgi:RNA polymerase sigma factor (sigma-70 family)
MNDPELPAVPDTLEGQVARASAGDRGALESVIHAIQRDVYRLAIRFLWHPQDAEDATQEILIRVITGLGSFRGESGFRTWVYRVASNALLTLRKQRMEQQALSFDQFDEDLAQGMSDSHWEGEDGLSQALLLEEVKVGWIATTDWRISWARSWSSNIQRRPPRLTSRPRHFASGFQERAPTFSRLCSPIAACPTLQTPADAASGWVRQFRWGASIHRTCYSLRRNNRRSVFRKFWQGYGNWKNPDAPQPCTNRTLMSGHPALSSLG